jgi:excisionase family DNA binding protein
MARHWNRRDGNVAETGAELVSSPAGEGAATTPQLSSRGRSWPERLLTVAEASECIGCCEETIRRAYTARQLEVLRFGSRNVRIRRAALDAWLERGGKTSAA